MIVARSITVLAAVDQQAAAGESFGAHSIGELENSQIPTIPSARESVFKNILCDDGH